MEKLASRPLRADARRNRERVVAAAGTVFAEHGRDAQMDDVAKHAGVGVGTVYRHFPTKEALIEALAIDRFEKVLAAGREALLNPDPWDAFAGSIWAGAALTASDRSFTEIVGELSGPMPLPERLEREMRETYGELMRRAQEAGALRADVVFDDVPMLMCGIGMGALKPHTCPGAWQRHVAIVIDGLRSANATSDLSKVSCS
jgi:AcrR family transcriptional regulator